MGSAFLFPARLILLVQVRKRRRTSAGKVLRLIQDRLSDAEFGKNLANLSNEFATSADRQFQFQKRSQLFHPHARFRTAQSPTALLPLARR